jgi:phosphatidylinositol glycan class M
MLAQTFAFVSLNKVCTSQVRTLPFPLIHDSVLMQEQYFLWYMIFIPFYLPASSLLHRPILGLTAAALWVSSQALWLQQGFQLEFNGISTFVPGLWLSSLLFFAVNAWILGIIVSDVGSHGGDERGDQGGDKRSRHRSKPMMHVGGGKESGEVGGDGGKDKRSKHRSRPMMRVQHGEIDAN